MRKKIIALSFLVTYALTTFYPGVAFALTNGPSQPESEQFQSASISNLVDPFSGDFSYNIPLLDVDGYPVNLAYNSGGSMDDESSWVGFGWNINPGSISRVMKGIPDDFNGEDKIRKEYNIKPDITGGVSFNISSPEVFGMDFLGANANVDIFYNNQKGLGVEMGLGISASLNTAKHVSGEYTKGLSAGGNLGITSNSQTGADFNFGLNFGIEGKNKENNAGAAGLRFGGSLNSRAGLKSTSLGLSFNTSKKEATKEVLDQVEAAQKAKKEFGSIPLANSKAGGSYSLGSFTSTYGQAYTPTITMPMTNQSYSLSPQAGLELWGIQMPVQLTGHYTIQKLATPDKYFPAFGFLHAAKGRTNPNAVLDFNREKDVPYMDGTPTLSVPYVTPDLFTATSHLGSSQFKAFSSSSGIFFDPYASNTSTAFSIGVEFGAGAGVKGGGDMNANGSSTVSRKWILNNDFIHYGDFKKATQPEEEEVYFKLVGEKSSVNKNFLNKIGDRDPVKIKTDDVHDEAKAFATLQSNTTSYPVSGQLTKNEREARGEVLASLTASQATLFGLDKTINDYTELGLSDPVSCTGGIFGNSAGLPRVNAIRKSHHLSQLSVVKADGIRLVYGIPVYNNYQTDVTFSVSGTGDADNMVSYSNVENSKKNVSGADNYFSRETVPSYSTSFLLSGICSPDYVDVTGNGISDDDLGTAVKFNYSLVNPAYQWRAPNAATGTNYANFNAGLKSDTKDNKANISYGSKELWYMHSVESKNMIAVFRLSNREDGLGFNPNGSIDLASRQKKLDRIDLYTKAELLKSNPVPVKSVHFEYDYSLFGNIPNNSGATVLINNVNVNASKGKLTLKSVYFTYADNTSGGDNRYYFSYNDGGNFKSQQYDRWGHYKDANHNASIAGISLDNNDFPYTLQDQTTANSYAGKWQLSQIELPSGGRIQVSYESDDYAFVQNKRAMQMAPIVGYGVYNANGPMTDAQGNLIDGNGNPIDYRKTDKIYIKLPAATDNNKIKQEYFQDIDQLYFKTMVNIDNQGSNELVSGWAQFKSVSLVSGTNNIAEVTLEKRGQAGYHPVVAASWQFMRLNLPKLAYPYEVNEALGPVAFVMALITAIGNVGELLTPFENKAMRKDFGSKILPGKGFARINNLYKKLGGGSRVKQIIMNDRWQDMAGAGNGLTTTTGMAFKYTMDYTAENGTVYHDVSSGVASYEPMSGSEENPFKQPLPYQQRQHLTSNIFTVEEPLGESYFPAPSVGYSQVKITNLDAAGQEVTNGYTLKKFFTARDFPTVVKRTDLSVNKYNQKSIFGLFDIEQGNSVVLSQGFYVENNDMHGKTLSEETFDGTGKMLAGTYYHYKSSGTESMSLDNNALTLLPGGSVKNQVIGQETEIYHDMREQITDNLGVNVNLNLDVLYFVLFVVPVPTAIPIVQNSYCGYQSASTIKVVNRYAIPDKITVIENGSTISTENLLWDALTGQVLLTKTQNGFDDPVYNFSLPAYMVQEYEKQLDNSYKTVDYEKGMGPAYKNMGILFQNQVISSGQPSSPMTGLLTGGDELGYLPDGGLVWAMETPAGIRLIDKNGVLFSGNGDFILLRSGRRNILGASSYSVVSLTNPIRNGKIEINQDTRILNSSAGTYSDEWLADVRVTELCRNDAKDGWICCPLPLNQRINPYYTGLKGNWRSNKAFVYSTDRDAQLDPLNQSVRPTNIRKGGIFDQFTSFYQIQAGRFISSYHQDDKWIASSYVTRVNGKGQELENKDALDRYGSVQFGFNQLLATAVAGNARSNELAFDGFEDYSYATSCGLPVDSCNEDGHFNFIKAIRYTTNANMEVKENIAHTGRSSLWVKSGYAMATTQRNISQVQPDPAKYTFNSSNEMLLQKGALVSSFEPYFNKKYLVSGWIRGDVATASDHQNNNRAKILVQAIDGSGTVHYIAAAVRSGPKVEGWVRVMGDFTIPAALSSIPDLKISIQLWSGNQDAYFDDIRIHPHEGSMKSFAYDYKNLRLMAELDENNYATFFEYSDEGQLLRNKKETEKGIATLKETRSYVRKNKQ